MAGKKPDRNDARLRERLLDVAESLYAQHGFSEVSFRQICVAAGARNNFAVQYHFGDLDTLTAAILERRAVHYEMRRGELLAEAVRTEPLNVRMILEIMQRPIIELRDEQGEPLGARFMIALQNTSWGWKPLSNLLDHAPVTQQLIRSLEDIVSHLPPPVIWQRVYLTTQMITNCAAQVPSQGSPGFREAVLRNVFAMAAAAMIAPLDENDARAMTEFHGAAPDAGREFEQGVR